MEKWLRLRAARNMYAHAYEEMDKISIWETATGDISVLQQFCKDILVRENWDKRYLGKSKSKER
ncbi:MAG: DUF86 domain-containing protein [Endomicrobium sp.]|nr:DUF86 domain-containing protein [Endomicrobium sp.]